MVLVRCVRVQQCVGMCVRACVRARVCVRACVCMCYIKYIVTLHKDCDLMSKIKKCVRLNCNHKY